MIIEVKVLWIFLIIALGTQNVNRFFKLFSNTAFFWPQIEGSFCNKVVLKILAPLCVLCVETHFVKANKYGQFHLLQSPDVNERWPSFSLVYWFKLSCLSFVHCNSPLISLHWRSDDLENNVGSQEGTKNRKSFILPQCTYIPTYLMMFYKSIFLRNFSMKLWGIATTKHVIVLLF